MLLPGLLNDDIAVAVLAYATKAPRLAALLVMPLH